MIALNSIIYAFYNNEKFRSFIFPNFIRKGFFPLNFYSLDLLTATYWHIYQYTCVRPLKIYIALSKTEKKLN